MNDFILFLMCLFAGIAIGLFMSFIGDVWPFESESTDEDDDDSDDDGDFPIRIQGASA